MATEVWSGRTPGSRRMSEDGEAKTREDLDLLECPDPDCDGNHPIPIVHRCHRGAPVLAVYNKELGEIGLVCSACRTLFVTIAVAAREVH